MKLAPQTGLSVPKFDAKLGDTETGLKVKADLMPRKYSKGVKVTDQQMRGLRLHRHKTCPTRNYTIKPKSGK